MAGSQNSVNHEEEALKESVNNRLYELEKTHKKEAAYLREAVANSSNGYLIISEIMKQEATNKQLAEFARFAMKHQEKGNQAIDDKALLERLRENFSRMTVRSAAKGTADAVVSGGKGLMGGVDMLGKNAPDGMAATMAVMKAVGGLGGGTLVGGAAIASGAVIGLIGLYLLYKVGNAVYNKTDEMRAKSSANTTKCDNAALTEASLNDAFGRMPELRSPDSELDPKKAGGVSSPSPSVSVGRSS